MICEPARLLFAMLWFHCSMEREKGCLQYGFSTKKPSIAGKQERLPQSIGDGWFRAQVGRFGSLGISYGGRHGPRGRFFPPPAGLLQCRGQRAHKDLSSLHSGHVVCRRVALDDQAVHETFSPVSFLVYFFFLIAEISLSWCPCNPPFPLGRCFIYK